MSAPLLPHPSECPVCGEPYLVFVTNKLTVRTKRELPMYGCFACNSFSNPSAYVESDDVMKSDLEWHKKVADRNAAATRTLLDELDSMNVRYGRIIDIGAGIGTLIKAAMERGSTGIGYEVNPHTQPYAQLHNGVDVRSAYWTPDTYCSPFDLMTCIMVLERIPEPRTLIRDMVTACIREGAALFVSVPFFSKGQWKFIHEADPRAPGNQFFDNDVHVTHFSPMGMENVLKEFGMKRISWVRKGLWHGIVAQP